MNYLGGFLIIVAIGAAAMVIARLVSRSARGRRRGFGGFGWVLLLPGSGRKSPPLRSQIDADIDEKKSREHTGENP